MTARPIDVCEPAKIEAMMFMRCATARDITSCGTSAARRPQIHAAALSSLRRPSLRADMAGAR